MKTSTSPSLLSLGFLLCALIVTHAQQSETATDDKPAGANPAPVNDPGQARPIAIGSSATNNVPGEKGLRFNFRNAPLDMVLNYMSEAAGFVIILETEVSGKVDVWSNQPLSKEESVNLLNTVLNKNGYAAIRNDKVLTIVKKEDAKKRDIAVKSGSDPKSIPRNDEMVTQIVPVRYANATQLTRDLQPLLPDQAIMTANENGNALVITDTQANIRRMAQIVNALDTSMTNVAVVKVYPLQFADAKELATAVKELFQPPTQQTNNRGGGSGGNPFFNAFRGGGGPFGPGGPGGGGQGGGGGGRGGGSNNSSSGAMGPAASKVVAVADERTNSLVVSAPEEVLPTIEKLIEDIDVSSSDETELRVFRLLNADPLEMADIFAQLFPDETRTSGNNPEQNQGFRFGGGRNRGNSTQSQQSERMKKKGRVLAVADQRTSSIIVSASAELMPEIEEMVRQLDSSSAKKQKVFVYSLENADVQQVEQIVRDMFDRGTQGNRTTGNQNSALQNRSLNQNQTPNSGFGATGFGNSGQGFGQNPR